MANYKPCPQCRNTFLVRYPKQWRCPKCTARWKQEKLIEKEALQRAESCRPIPGAPPPLVAHDAFAPKKSGVPESESGAHLTFAKPAEDAGT